MRIKENERELKYFNKKSTKQMNITMQETRNKRLYGNKN